MVAERAARLVGACITAGLISLSIISFRQPFELPFPIFLLLFLLACPTIAVIFTLPDPTKGMYFINACVIAIVIALVTGISWISIDEDLGDNVAFWEGFTIGILPALLGAGLGGIALHGRQHQHGG